jgi:gliding motility associated protien GldN
MKKLIVSLSVFATIVCLAPLKGNAQIIDGAYKREDVIKRKPMMLPTVREADVYWSKMVWRIIDLREKINQPLYYPTHEMNGRFNLVSLLLKGIESGAITAYDASTEDNEFKTPLEFKDVKNRFGATTETVEKRNIDTGGLDTVQLTNELRVDEVKRLMIKEEWYFDKQNSTLNVRIIGLCPIREYIRTDDPNKQIQRTQLFWVYYPHVRDFLATNDVFNPYNDARQMTFDDLFIKRYFNSYIVRESNTYNNRAISQYLAGKDAMYESQLIENEIFDFEQNLWEY